MDYLYDYGLHIYRSYEWTLTLADPTVEKWPLVKSPAPVLSLIAIYLMMVSIGPRIMQNRKPFKLKWILVTYNLGITLLNVYIAVALFSSATQLNYSWLCQPFTFIKTPDELRMGSALWWYYVSKLIEFTDTVFFILRKKNTQLSFLHVYHHSTMFFFWWIGIKWVPGGSSFVAAGLNSVVHVLMYAYYGLSALGPWIHKYLWWKKYLTVIQLIQFCIALGLGFNSLRINCDFPMWMQYTLIVYMCSFILLFGNFYRNAYTKKKMLAASKRDEDRTGTTAAYMNGKANGHVQMANGCVKHGQVDFGSFNGYTKLKGYYGNGSIHANGFSNGHCNGDLSDLADEYIEIRSRKIAK